MPLDRASLIPALKNIATQLRIDSIRSTSEAGSGHPTSCCSAADLVAALFFAEMRFDPEGSAASRQRSLRAVEGPRRAAAVRGVGRSRRVRPRRAAEAAADRLRSRRPSDAAAAVRRRRHRLARPGHLRRDRHRAERAPDQVGLPDLRAARRRRVGRRIGVGGGRRRRHRRPRQPVRHHRRQRRSARAARRCGSTTWSSSRAAGARSAGTRSSSTATT